MELSPEFDVAIVGAGLAGTACAHVISTRLKARVALIDPRSQFAECFKAEKVEPDQAKLLRDLNLFEIVRPYLAPIKKVEHVLNGRVLSSRVLEQYGVPYHNIVNALGAHLNDKVTRISSHVVDIKTHSKQSTIELSDGKTIRARLVILTTGTHQTLSKSLNLHRKLIEPDYYSMAFGFSIQPFGTSYFDFESLTCFPSSFPSKIAFLTIFPFQTCMRVNLFTYHQPKEIWVHEFLKNPIPKLLDGFSNLLNITGEFSVVDKLHSYAISLYKLASVRIPGMVCLSDCYQSSCPASGTGLSKVLTDVQTLCTDYIPLWLKADEISEDLTEAFYRHPKKVECDRHSLNLANYQKKFATESSLQWWLHRKKTFLQMRMDGFNTEKPQQYAQTYPFTP